MNIAIWDSWRECAIASDATLAQAAAAADRGGKHIAVMVNESGALRAILTDGDLRRAQLAGARSDRLALDYAVCAPITAPVGRTRVEYARSLRENNISHLPLVDDEDRLVDIAFREIQRIEDTGTWAVVMAGGFGKRLAPLTDTTPKPLLPVGGIPMLERIIRSLSEAGIKTIVLSVFHMADQIRAFCGDGVRWGVRIIYIQEDSPRGTAGALALLPERPRDQIIVMNGDILTNLSFRALLNYHREQDHVATMCVNEQRHQVQYGVVKFDGLYISEIQEKPVHSYFISAGIYAFNPDVLDLIPKDRYFDMPSLFQVMADGDMRPGAFPIRELWLDIGTMSDYEAAQKLAGPQRLRRACGDVLPIPMKGRIIAA